MNLPNIHHFGKFDAKGPALIIQFKERDFKNIKWEDLRIFFYSSPNESKFHSLRIKPTITSTEKKVFVIPPAPTQWIQEMDIKRQNLQTEDDLILEIILFVEDVLNKKFLPYGVVNYVFSKKPKE